MAIIKKKETELVNSPNKETELVNLPQQKINDQMSLENQDLLLEEVWYCSSMNSKGELKCVRDTDGDGTVMRR